ncbi:DegT/DnrJ/EryC1/StrS family aminotransferase, partial [Candidatus Bathyarchaeota archaeon]|nr:DegT/DnrJ/EryC1/StrS family aminotransferase [Candidatus Bathyarchaeota archaeon]
ETNLRRIQGAHLYDEGLSKIGGIRCPTVAENRKHIYHLYVIRVIEHEYGRDRDKLFKILSTKGIGLSVHYTPLHMLSLYKELGYKYGEFPVAEQIYKEILSLPLFPAITSQQISQVMTSISQAQTCRD